MSLKYLTRSGKVYDPKLRFYGNLLLEGSNDVSKRRHHICIMVYALCNIAVYVFLGTMQFLYPDILRIPTPPNPTFFFIIYSQACVWLLRDFRLVSFYGKIPRPCGRNVEESPRLSFSGRGSLVGKNGEISGKTRKFRKKWEQN
jgi:hypothetical protein